MWLILKVYSFAKIHESGLGERCGEKDLSAEQYQTEEDPRISGADEHAGRPKCLEAKENEGKKEIERLTPKFLKARCERTISVYPKRANHQPPRFQKGDEIRKETSLLELHPVLSKEWEPVSSARHCGKKRGRTGDLPESSQAIFTGVLSTS